MIQFKNILCAAGLLAAAISSACVPGASLPAVQEPLDSQEWKTCADDLAERQSMGMIDDLTLDGEALLCSAVVAAAAGEIDDALDKLTEAGVRDPENFRPHYMAGRILSSAGRYEEALAAFERSQERFPEMEVPTERLGRDAAEKEGDAAALSLLKKAEKRGLCAYGCRGFMAKLYVRGKEIEKAEKIYSAMIKEEPSEPAAYVGMGAVKNAQGDYLAESEWLTKATKASAFEELSAGARADIHYSHAFSRYNAKKYKGAAKSIDRAIALEKGHADWYVLAGWIQLKLSNSPIALAKFEKAAKLDPTCAAAHAGMGDALIALSQYEDAEASLEKAAKLDSADSVILLKLAYAKALRNKKDEARTLVEKAKATDPDHLPADLIQKVTKLLD